MSGVKDIIDTYNKVVRVIDTDAKEQKERSYGGMIREMKGKLQEFITEECVKVAWGRVGGDANRLEINSKKIKIPIQRDYINNIKQKEVKSYILNNISDYHYGLSVDKHIFIDNKFIMGIECKNYTENAMIKRILVDFSLLKTIYPNLKCFLF